MLSLIKSMVIIGITGQLVSVQVDVSNGLPYFEIVGLPDTTVKESKERVRVAIKNSGYDIRSKRVIINLAPANIRKIGSIFDLPIAIGVLASLNIVNKEEVEKYVIIGELSLNGEIKRVPEAFAICIEMRKLGLKNIVMPFANGEEVKYLEGMNIYLVRNLREVVDFLNNQRVLEKLKIEKYDRCVEKEKDPLDFSDIYGQELAKRALEISAAGGHNCLMTGSPGSGKTMLAQRMTSILPNLSLEEALEVNKINSLYGENKSKMTLEKPFRAPHYTISESGLIGGGAIPRPGEVTLANMGVLFLDELTEFKKNVLETLRIPLEDRKVTISRVRTKITYPANFILIGAMNPCPCGYYGSPVKECTCTNITREKYIHRISGPLLDRFDIFVNVYTVKLSEMNKKAERVSSSVVRERVVKARTIQLERYKKHGITINSELNNNHISAFCKLDSKSNELLEKFYQQNKISVRAYNKILKVARTIADLEEKENIEYRHIAEALQYRRKGENL